jgi:hypothetical protein
MLGGLDAGRLECWEVRKLGGLNDGTDQRNVRAKL